jgi:hypothetical protein
MDRDEEVRNGQWAEQILKDERWIRFWEDYRLELFSRMENAKTDEGTIRGKLLLGVANDARAYMESMISKGKVAAHEIKLEAEQKKRIWPWAA